MKLKADVLEKLRLMTREVEAIEKDIVRRSNELAIIKSEAAEKRALHYRAVAEALSALDVPVEATAICQDCGTLRPLQMQKCPECSKENR